jgi:hypothetical protein
MGSGLGHLTRLKPLVEHAVEAGHRVSLIVKELVNIHTIFDIKKLDLLQAPYQTTPAPAMVPISWSEMMLLRFASPARLANFVAAWRSTFDMVKPDLVIYDSSPAALMASFGQPWAKWTVGSPFFMPRIDMSHVGIFPSVKLDASTLKRLQRSEQSLLKFVNQAFDLAGSGQQINGVPDLVGQVDKELLTTLPEFDYFGARSTGEYVGMPASIGGGVGLPAWPSSSKFKVFAYLKNFPGLGSFLESLQKSGIAAVIYSIGIPGVVRKKYDSHVYMDSPASMDVVCAEADLVVHMAGSQTVARCMKVGVAQILISTGLEQLFTAQSAQKLGMAYVVHGTAKSYDSVIEQALLRIAKGKRPLEGIKDGLLDGSHYESRVAELVAGL